MSVAKLVLLEAKHPDVVIAALLHDVVKKTKVLRSYIKSKFSLNVTTVVNNVIYLKGY